MKLWGSEAALAREEKSSDSGEIWLWGFGVVWRALLQEVKHRSVQTHTETGCQSSTRHRRLRGPPRLSWLRDLEPAQSRPPSRSRPVQPCRQRVPFPPHLWDDTHCCTIISHRKQNVMRMWTVTPPKHQTAAHLESSSPQCLLPSSSEPSQTSSPEWSCCCQWQRDPEGAETPKSGERIIHRVPSWAGRVSTRGLAELQRSWGGRLIIYLLLCSQPFGGWPPLRSASLSSWRRARTPWGWPRWELPSSTAGQEPWNPSWEETRRTSNAGSHF